MCSDGTLPSHTSTVSHGKEDIGYDSFVHKKEANHTCFEMLDMARNLAAAYDALIKTEAHQYFKQDSAYHSMLDCAKALMPMVGKSSFSFCFQTACAGHQGGCLCKSDKSRYGPGEE